jgi:hypothetical protein
MQLYAASGVVDRGAGPEKYKDARLDAVTGALTRLTTNTPTR